MTFDNKTYNYGINDCMNLLYKGRAGVVPVAILARWENLLNKKICSQN